MGPPPEKELSDYVGSGRPVAGNISTFAIHQAPGTSLFELSVSCSVDRYARLEAQKIELAINGQGRARQHLGLHLVVQVLAQQLRHRYRRLMPVEIGQGLEIAHGGFGIVIHPSTKIGNSVKIYPGVTLGRSDIYQSHEHSSFQGILIDDNVILSPGCKILAKTGVLKVGRGTVIGANAVLLESTADSEIWAGIPAKKIGERENYS